MKQLKRFFAVFGAAVASVAMVASVAQPASADTPGDEAAFVAKLNGLRASVGLPALQVNGDLTTIARNWSTRMAQAGTISHNPDLAAQAPSTWMRLGENVGVGPDVDGLHTAFVNSSAHYHNMVDPQFTQVGIGVVRDASGTIFVTVDFMTAGAVAFTAPAAPAAPAAAHQTCSRRRGKVTCRTVKPRAARTARKHR